MTKHDAIHEFLGKKVQELTEKTLGFNFSGENIGSVSVVTNYAGNVRKKYIRMGAEKE